MPPKKAPAKTAATKGVAAKYQPVGCYICGSYILDAPDLLTIRRLDFETGSKSYDQAHRRCWK
jgi:hypothetical protein